MLDLDAIEARAKRAWEIQPPEAALDMQVICEDVPALVAEVRRLRLRAMPEPAETRSARQECPNCGATTVHASGGGIKCPTGCGYWFCW